MLLLALGGRHVRQGGQKPASLVCIVHAAAIAVGYARGVSHESTAVGGSTAAVVLLCVPRRCTMLAAGWRHRRPHCVLQLLQVPGCQISLYSSKRSTWQKSSQQGCVQHQLLLLSTASLLTAKGCTSGICHTGKQTVVNACKCMV